MCVYLWCVQKLMRLLDPLSGCHEGSQWRMSSWVSGRTDISPVWKEEAEPVQGGHVCTALRDLQKWRNHGEDFRSYDLCIQYLYLKIVKALIYKDYHKMAVQCYSKRLEDSTGWTKTKKRYYRSVSQIQYPTFSTNLYFIDVIDSIWN